MNLRGMIVNPIQHAQVREAIPLRMLDRVCCTAVDMRIISVGVRAQVAVRGALLRAFERQHLG